MDFYRTFLTVSLSAVSLQIVKTFKCTLKFIKHFLGPCAKEYDSPYLLLKAHSHGLKLTLAAAFVLNVNVKEAQGDQSVLDGCKDPLTRRVGWVHSREAGACQQPLSLCDNHSTAV